MPVNEEIGKGTLGQHQLFADQVRKQYEHTFFGTSATLINSAILVFILRDQVPHLNLAIWLTCATVVSAGRLIGNWFYQKSSTRYSNPKRWHIGFIATLFLSGVLWGSTAIFLFPSASIGHQAFVAFVSGGMVAGAVGAFTAVLPAFFLFSLPALFPIIARFFLLGGEIHIAMGAMVLLFLFLTSMVAKRLNQNVISLLALKYEREALISNLENEVQQRKNAEDNLRWQKEQVEEIVMQRTAELKNANQRLRAILNYAPVVIWAIDQQGRVTFADGKGAKNLGLSPQQAVGKFIHQLYSEDSGLTHISERVLAGEFISESINYHDLSYEVRYHPMMNADLHPVGAIGVAIDVTAQTAAKEALVRSKEKYQDLVENINDVIFAIDKANTITYISPVIEMVLGYRAETLIGKCFLDYIDHQDLSRVQRDFSRVLEEAGKQGDYRLIDKAGEIKWCRVSARPVRERGDAMGIHGVLVDITSKKRLEEQLQRAQKMEALGILAGGVAHDLNNILSGLVSLPDLLLMDMPDDNPLWRPLNAIRQSGENAAAVVQDLVTLARRGVPIVELLNLNHMVRRCLKSLEVKSLMEAHPEISMTTDLHPDLFNIYGSSVHIFTSLFNLISNAVEAMPDGGHIAISTEHRYADKTVLGYESVKEGEYVVLTIADTGIGISERDQVRIFEPFYTKKVMERSGSGLGMAVVWGTVKDHHGYIDLKSKAGHGACFQLYFPATRDQLDITGEPKKESSYTGNGEVVLVVDDMPLQREIATGIIDRLGYRAKSVASGEEAIAFLRKNQADLLILDMIMEPGMDGYETYRQIQKVRPGQKAIIASGYSESDRVRQAQALGAGKYIKKPYTSKGIGKLIKQALTS